MVLGTKFDGVNCYISLTCVAKEYLLRYGKKYNVSLGLRNIHESYLIKGMGAGAKCYINVSILEFFLSRQKSFPKEFCDELREFALNFTKDDLAKNKALAIDVVADFLPLSNKLLTVRRNVKVGNDIYDLFLSEKIFVRFINESEKRESALSKVGNYDCIDFNYECSTGKQLWYLCLNIKKLTE